MKLNYIIYYNILFQFGPNGFTFAINANGYIVFHPKLKVQNDLKDPPNVDFLEVEVETDATVQVTFIVFLPPRNRHLLSIVLEKYFYRK
jgi:hypothetical protein